jgi:hypothetical protein
MPSVNPRPAPVKVQAGAGLLRPDDSAFPSPPVYLPGSVNPVEVGQCGLSVREYTACLCLAQLGAVPGLGAEDAADRAVRLADALLERLARSNDLDA